MRLVLNRILGRVLWSNLINLPMLMAGNDLNVEINTKVNLDGSQSSDEDGEIVSYKWEQTGGPEINLRTV